MEEADAISQTARAYVLRAARSRFAVRAASQQSTTPQEMELNAASIADVALELVNAST